MIRNSILLAIVLALSVIPACSGGDATTPGVRAAGTIQGLVFDVAADEPLTGAVVEITSTPFATDLTGTGVVVIITATEENGRFNRSDIPNGSIRIKVSRDGYVTPGAQYWALSPGGAGDFRFDMAPGEDPVPEFEGDEQSARPPDWGKIPDE